MWVKRAIGALLYHAGGDVALRAWRERRRGPALCILSGHRVIDEREAERLDDVRDLRRGALSLAAFMRAIAFLKDHYRIVPLEQAVATIRETGAPPPRSVVLTFDDAFKDVAVRAHPALNEANVPFTVFLTTSYLGVNPRMLDREDVRRMREDPLVGWGAHGVTHGVLTEADDARLTREVEDSRKVVEDLTGRTVRHFCYPDGRYDARVVERVRAAGYEAACATGRRVNYADGLDLFALTRVPFDNEPLSRFAFRVAGRG